MLRSQMQIEAAQTKRSAASTDSESKLKQYCNSRHVARQTTDNYNITSFYDSTSNLKFSPPFIKSHRVE